MLCLLLCGGLQSCLEATIEITPALQSIAIEPNAIRLIPGETIQIQVKATYTDGTTQFGSTGLIWSNSHPEVISLQPSTNTITALAPGSATLTAQLADSKATATIEVPGNDAILLGLSISPEQPSVAVGQTLSLLATGLYKDGSSKPLTEQVSWLSSNPNYATIDKQTGLITGLAPGAVSFLATSAGVGASVQGQITPSLTTLKTITAFAFRPTDNSNLTAISTGQISGTTITIQLPFGTDITSLRPTLTFQGASISPLPTVRQDFTTPITYTITAEDGSVQSYTVQVQLAASDAKQITQFVIAGVQGTISGTNITLPMPAGTDANTLTPTITFSGTTLIPASGVTQNFRQPVSYTVIAANGTLLTYTVTVTVAPSANKAITSLSILGVQGTLVGTNIAINLPEGTSLTSLTPTIAINGASIQPASGVARNFTTPVQYTVTAEDQSTQVYTVTASVAPSSSKTITGFELAGQSATITGTAITVTLPFGSSLLNLTPTITHTGTTLTPAANQAQHFLNPIQYTVTAANGTQQIYTVFAQVAANPAKDITSFALLNQPGHISGTTIEFLLPHGTSLNGLIPTLVHTGASISPPQSSAQNFASPVNYTVTAADGTSKTYTVQVNLAPNTANNIIAFKVLDNQGTIQGTNIQVDVPFGTNLTNLQPTITIDGVGIMPASGVGQDFTLPVAYTVQAANNSTKIYTVTVTPAAADDKEITSFQLFGVAATIVGNNITCTLPFGTDISQLTPTLSIRGQFVSPGMGESQDFRVPVNYVVTADNGSQTTYTVQVTVASNSAKDVLAFSLLGYAATIGSNTISLMLPHNTLRSALTPSIDISGVAIQPASLAVQDFTNPVVYTVTAADNTTKVYTATITEANSPNKDITALSILGNNGVIGANTVVVTVPFGTDVTALAPLITISGASIVPASGTPLDFTNAQSYLITAADSSTKSYSVSVQWAANTAKEITSFSIAGTGGIISGTDISVIMPYNTDRSQLIPSITITGQSVSPASGVQQDFTLPRTYTVQAADNSIQDYTITVTNAANPAKEITAFSIMGIAGQIVNDQITLTVPFGTDLTDLTPTITITGQMVNPASDTPQDFTSPVLYQVTAANNTTNSYTVTVALADEPTHFITRVQMAGREGIIGPHAVVVHLPFATDVTSLSPTIAFAGDSLHPISGLQQDFTLPVNYIVTAADGSEQAYSVLALPASNLGKAITHFSIGEHPGHISANRIQLTLPFDTDVTQLTPTITWIGSTVSPASGVSQDFTSPVDYIVTANNGTTLTYEVTVVLGSDDSTLIQSYELAGYPGIIGNNTIDVTLPYDAELSYLIPHFSHLGLEVTPASGVGQNFNQPVIYTVTAFDGGTHDYTVTVHLSDVEDKDLLRFTLLDTPANISANAATLTLPFGTDVTALSPRLIFQGQAVNPPSDVPQDFSMMVPYTITAADGSTKTYNVTVNLAPSNSKNITSFQILGRNGVILGNSITLELPHATSLTNLTPTILHTGVAIDPPSLQIGNFLGPVTYTVTAADTSEQDYTVQVTAAPSPTCNIVEFSVGNRYGIVSYDVVDLYLPSNFGPIDNVTPTVMIDGASVVPASGDPVDLASVLDYIVDADNGDQKSYIISTHISNATDKDILVFSIDHAHANIVGTNITLTLPSQTSLTNLTPMIIHTGVGISPNLMTPQDFSTPVVYTVTDENSDIKAYTVTVSLATIDSKQIQRFVIDGVEGVIVGTDITIDLPAVVDVTALKPMIAHTGATIIPASDSYQDFTTPVSYTVTADDSSNVIYTVQVNTP